ncbi:MAG: small multi-drug export protein [Chloroflexi bacterium]|nr:small multi-drug export protein [Chloroflexota bacterium]
MVEALLQWLNMPGELLVIIISALPVVELRGSIPLGIGLLHLPWYVVAPLAIVGNLLPVPVLLLFFRTLVKYARRVPLGAKLVDPLVRHAERHSAAVEKYERLGLMIFVGIPIPWTGAWTGSMIASLLGMGFIRAFLSIAGGVIISGAIVTALFMLGWFGFRAAQAGLPALAIAALWQIYQT